MGEPDLLPQLMHVSLNSIGAGSDGLTILAQRLFPLGPALFGMLPGFFGSTGLQAGFDKLFHIGISFVTGQRESGHQLGLLLLQGSHFLFQLRKL